MKLKGFAKKRAKLESAEGALGLWITEYLGGSCRLDMVPRLSSSRGSDTDHTQVIKKGAKPACTTPCMMLLAYFDDLPQHILLWKFSEGLDNTSIKYSGPIIDHVPLRFALTYTRLEAVAYVLVC